MENKISNDIEARIQAVLYWLGSEPLTEEEAVAIKKRLTELEALQEQTTAALTGMNAGGKLRVSTKAMPSQAQNRIGLYAEAADISATKQKMSWAEALERFGSDGTGPVIYTDIEVTHIGTKEYIPALTGRVVTTLTPASIENLQVKESDENIVKRWLLEGKITINEGRRILGLPPLEQE